MAKASIMDAATKLYGILKGLDPDDRQRVVDATLTLLGEPARKGNARGNANEENEDKGVYGDRDGPQIPEKAKAWMTKNGITVDQLTSRFHFDRGTVTCIELAGNANSKRSKTIDTYLMQGITAFLTTGEPSFSDKDARKLCLHFGCYNSPNHSKTIKDLKNNITGNIKSGWKLTAPGLAAAAKLLKSQAAGE